MDAIVARAPDNVLYLTNFWGMKGFDAVLFPREGEPTLFCLEASAEDAAGTAWTSDVCLVEGYRADDPRPPVLRTLERAAEAAREHGVVGLELSLGTQASDRMVGEPTTFTKGWFDAFGDAVDATPLLAAARAIKTEQELERMRLANDIAAAAMDHVRGVIRPGMTEAQIASEWLGFVHGDGTGWAGQVELALGFSLVWAGPGIRTFTATSNRPVLEGEPTLFEIWVCADGYWCDHTKNVVVGELTEPYRDARGGPDGGLRRCGRPLQAGRQPRGARPARPRRRRADRLSRPAVPPDLPRGGRPRARAPVRAPGRRRRGGGGHGSCNRTRMLLAGRRRASPRGQLADHRRRAGEALHVPRRHREGGRVIDRTKVWTGDVNRMALEPQPHVTVGLYDTTLRDGEQTIGVVLTPDEKLEIARALDAAGVDRIEAGFPRVSDDDFRAVEMIAAAGLRAEVWGFSRAVPADVEALVELGVRSSVIESPISDGKLDALGVSRETMLDRIRSAVTFATDNGIHVAFFGVDSSRADLEFFDRAYAAAVEAGAAEIVVVDTLGIATPEAAALLVSRALDRVDVPVHWHGHDDFGLGTAAAIAAVQAGATWVQGTVNGMGERAGNADLVEVALALEALYGIPTRLDLTQARALSRLVAERAATPLPPWKAVTGEALFTRESGAVAAQFHDPPAIEPYASELVGAERGIVLGKKSGIDSIRIALERLGLDVPTERHAELLALVKAQGTKHQRLVTDTEFRRLVSRVRRK